MKVKIHKMKTSKIIKAIKESFIYLKSSLKSNIKYSFTVPFIIKNILGEAESIESKGPFYQYLFSITTLQLFVLFGILNILFYILVLYLIQKYDIESKFTNETILRIIKFYKNISKFVLIFEVLLLLIIQFFIIGINTYLLWTL